MSGLLPRVFGALLAASLLALLGCADSKAKSEASRFARLVDAVRSAPNDFKRTPFDQLRAFACSAPDVCAARKACVDAFEHHVRGIELTAELRKRMASGNIADLPEQDRQTLGRKLLEANIELDQGREMQPTCDQLVTDMRIRRRL